MLPLPNRTEGEKQGPGAVGGSAPVRQADIDGVQVRDDRRLVMVALAARGRSLFAELTCSGSLAMSD